MGKRRKNPPCPCYKNIRCKYSVNGRSCKIHGCHDPTDIDRNNNLYNKIV